MNDDEKPTGRELVVGDLHGNYRGLMDVLKKSKFDYENDQLICLGDICDGYRRTREVVEELLKIKHLIYVRGNHCDWWLKWLKAGVELPIWYHQGGISTIESYDYDWKLVPKEHKDLVRNSIPYYIDDDLRIFCHGGFNPNIPIDCQRPEDIMWNRQLCGYAKNVEVPIYLEVYVGHTTTQYFYGKNYLKPAFHNNLIMMDTGGGWWGKVTIMDVKTHKYWQSGVYDPRSI